MGANKMEQDKRKELKEAFEYMNKMTKEIVKWQEETKGFFDQALGNFWKIEKGTVEKGIQLELDYQKAKKELSDKITSGAIESMDQFKGNIDNLMSCYNSMGIHSSEKVKSLGKAILTLYLEYFGKTDLYGPFKIFLPEKNYNQIVTAHKELVSHLEETIDTLSK